MSVDDKPCVKCGKLAVVPPLCLGCMLDMPDDKYTRVKALAAVIELFPTDESNECRMCGKPTADRRPDGFCGTCRTIWNG